MKNLLASDTAIQAMVSIIVALVAYVVGPILVELFRKKRNRPPEPKQPSKLIYVLAAVVLAPIAFVVVGELIAALRTPPSVAITTPTSGEQIEVRVAQASGAGSFFVDGSSTKVASDPKLRVYVLVHPAHPYAPGWWVYKSSGTDQKGNWSAEAWYGDRNFPPEVGRRIEIMAVVIDPNKVQGRTKIDEPNEIAPVAQSDMVRVSIRSVR